MAFVGSADPESERVATSVVNSIYAVHKVLGPGLLESVYETCLAFELGRRGLIVGRQVPVPVVYDGVTLDAALRIDLLVNDRVIVEVKAVESLIPIHEAQLITYLKLSGKRIGFLVNFNVSLVKDGLIRRVL